MPTIPAVVGAVVVGVLAAVGAGGGPYGVTGWFFAAGFLPLVGGGGCVVGAMPAVPVAAVGGGGGGGAYGT